MEKKEQNRQLEAATDKNGKINVGLIARFAAPFVFNGLRWAAENIKQKALRLFLQNCAINRTEAITGLLIDSNPANNEQLSDYWRREKFNIAKDLIAAANEIIAELESEENKEAAAELKKLKG